LNIFEKCGNAVEMLSLTDALRMASKEERGFAAGKLGKR